jgi:hypothetical protein
MRRWLSGRANSDVRRLAKAPTVGTTIPFAFSLGLAGGGIKALAIFGATGEYWYKVVENRCNIHDLHATILHQVGINHTRLTYRFSGRDFRLTDV